MKKIKIQIKSIYGKILFEYSKEDNTIKDTLIEAIKSRANLFSADLSGADLYGADLYGADLSRANLSRANLYGANLSGANLSGADLFSADLSRADLSGAYLYGANLYGANLSGADLFSADLFSADLSGANLSGAYLSGANLYGANLSGANLSGADLSGADINKIKHLFQIIPMEGSFIAWKKLANNCLAKIEIPAKAPRTFSIIGRKCRAKYVKTLAIWDNKGNIINEQYGQRDNNLLYKVGKLTHADKWDNNPMVECTHGIHFFISKQEAINY